MSQLAVRLLASTMGVLVFFCAAISTAQARDRLPPRRDDPDAAAQNGDEDPASRRTELREAIRHQLACPALDNCVLIPLRHQVIPAPRFTAWGDWSIAPFVAEKIEWDDNVYLTDGSEESDVVSLTTLGVRLQREGADFVTDVTAAVAAEVFADEDQDNVAGHVRAGLLYGREREYVRIYDVLSRSREAVQYAGPEGSTIVSAGTRTSQLLNTFGAAVGYDDVGFGAELGHTVTHREYGRRLDTLDSASHVTTLTGTYHYSPKLDLIAQGEYRDTDFERGRQNDTSGVGALAGARWYATPKLTLHGRAGYLGQDARSSGTVRDTNDFSGPVASLDATWSATAKTSIRVAYVHDIYVALRSNYQTVDNVALHANWEITSLLDAVLYATAQRSRPSASSAADSKTYGLGFTLLHHLGDNVDVGFSYAFATRNSDAADDDYDNHRIGLQLTLSF